MVLNLQIKHVLFGSPFKEIFISSSNRKTSFSDFYSFQHTRVFQLVQNDLIFKGVFDLEKY